MSPRAGRHAATDPQQPWRDPSQPAEVRADELLSALTGDEKIQLALGNFAALQSFGVPTLTNDDGPDGVRNPGTTALPSGQDLAAGFNRSLAYSYGQVAGSEARGEGFSDWLGPAVDIARTPLAGRQPEAEGEDPFLAGNTSASVVLGAKSQHIIATLKHYTAYNQDWGRIGFEIAPSPFVRGPGTNDLVSERALQEIYEAPFRTAVQQGGLDSLMCSYNQINGLPSCQNPTTLGDIKNGTGFDGFVVPDFGFAVRDPLAAALAGVDLPALPGEWQRGPDGGQLHLGADPRRPPRRHRPPDPVRDLRLRPVRRSAAGDPVDRGQHARPSAGRHRRGRGRHGSAQERRPRAAAVWPPPVDRADRPHR